MDQQRHLALTSGGFDALGASDQRAAASLQAKPVERLAAQRGFDPLAEVGRDVDIAGLERPGERALELALGIGLVQRLAPDADPGATARGAGANVGRDLAVGTEGEPDQLLPRRRPPGEDAAALGYVSV